MEGRGGWRDGRRKDGRSSTQDSLFCIGTGGKGSFEGDLFNITMHSKFRRGEGECVKLVGCILDAATFVPISRIIPDGADCSLSEYNLIVEIE